MAGGVVPAMGYHGALTPPARLADRGVGGPEQGGARESRGQEGEREEEMKRVCDVGKG